MKPNPLEPMFAAQLAPHDVRRLESMEAGKEFFQFFMSYFNGMTRTPADDFAVTEADFPVIEPADSIGLLALVNNQLRPFASH